jgi:thiol-disulfide isomerase/thioredoxin
MDKAWAARLPDEDRTALAATVGFAPPEFPEDLEWIGDQALTLESLRGKVVLIQSFTTRNTLGRNTPRRIARAVESFKDNEEFAGILVHTPEGANKAERYCTRIEMPFPVAIDTSGHLSDSIGAYKRPVNVLIDKTGNIAFAGLNDEGILQATKQLLAQPFDEKSEPTKRPNVGENAEGFPQFQTPLASAADLRGLEAPTFFVQNWITERPNANNKVAVIDFWATWCGPCVKAIPHMNDLQNQFKDDVVCVGISDEASDAFDAGLRRRDLGPGNFRYSLALDPTGQMKKRFAIRGIPHVAVISSDWIVRWQGHPNNLSADVLNAIVAANKVMVNRVGDGSPGAPPARWRAQS